MKKIDHRLLDQFRQAQRCELCGKRGPVDPHHLLGRGMGGGGRLDVRENLIALCRADHDRFHSGHVPRHVLLGIVAAREGTTTEELLDRLYTLRRMPNAK